jgi:hypothetical protein
MSAKGGPLSVTATWREGVFKDAAIQAFVENFQGVLDRVAAGVIVHDLRTIDDDSGRGRIMYMSGVLSL